MAGIAVAVGCGALTVATAGAGALACAVVGGALAGAVTSGANCRPGKSIAGCAVEGAAVGAVSGLAGGALGKLGTAGLAKLAEKRAIGTLASDAAEGGLSELEQGAARVPDEWGPGLANKKGVGSRWTDPADRGNGIRIDQGNPGSAWPSQQVDHVVVRSGGRVLGPDGKPIVGKLSENPEAHIPLSDWLNWSSWDRP